MLGLAENIQGIQVYVGEFTELVRDHDLGTVYYKEHPLNKNYRGIEEPRDWMFDVKGYYPSFFSFWKKCKKELGLPK
jgi:deoxyribodipyrimidine photo-lyase